MICASRLLVLQCLCCKVNPTPALSRLRWGKTNLESVPCKAFFHTGADNSRSKQTAETGGWGERGFLQFSEQIYGINTTERDPDIFLAEVRSGPAN